MLQLKVTHQVDSFRCDALISNEEIFIVFLNYQNRSTDPSNLLNINTYISFMLIWWLILNKSKKIRIRVCKCILYVQNMPTTVQLKLIHTLKLINLRNTSTLNCSFWKHTTLPGNKFKWSHQLLILISVEQLPCLFGIHFGVNMFSFLT
jgi:hypothetical protein